MSSSLHRHVAVALGLALAVATILAGCSDATAPTSQKKDTVIKPPPAISDTASDVRTLFPLRIGNRWDYIDSRYDSQGVYIALTKPITLEVVDTVRLRGILTYTLTQNAQYPAYYFYADSGRELRYFPTLTDTNSIGVLIAPHSYGDSVLLSPRVPGRYEVFTSEYFYGFVSEGIGSEQVRCNEFELFMFIPAIPPAPSVLYGSVLQDYAPGIGLVSQQSYQYVGTARIKADRLDLQKFTVH